MTQYKNPPIIEAVCEFRFSKEMVWSEDIAEEFFTKISDSFPNKQKRILKNLQFQTSQEEAKMQMHQKPLHAFWNHDKTMLIQLGDRYLSIHALKPYPSWKKFSPIIEEIYNSLRDLITIQKFERIGFVYSDKINIPKKSLKIEDYFNFFPYIGPNLPQNIHLFNISCDIPFEGERDNCRMTLGSTIPDKNEDIAFLLTTDYFLIDKDSINADNALEWVSCAHDHIKELFEGVITDHLKKTFEA